MFFKVITLLVVVVALCNAQSHGGHHSGSSYVTFSLHNTHSGSSGSSLGSGSASGLGGYGGGLAVQADSHGHGQHYVDYHAHPQYQFEYGIADGHTADHHSQQEHRDGDTVHGEYSLHEADGTIRTVKYTADKHNGFNAQVIRTGHAQHPAVHPRPAFVVHHQGGLSGGQSSGLGGHHGGY